MGTEAQYGLCRGQEREHMAAQQRCQGAEEPPWLGLAGAQGTRWEGVPSPDPPALPRAAWARQS